LTHDILLKIANDFIIYHKNDCQALFAKNINTVMRDKIFIKWAWFLPVLFIKSQTNIHDAQNYFLIVKINDKHFNNKALIQHELVHTKQFLRTFGLHFLLYKFNDSYRYKAELEAYKASKKYGQCLVSCATYLYQNYNIDKSFQTVITDLVS